MDQRFWSSAGMVGPPQSRTQGFGMLRLGAAFFSAVSLGSAGSRLKSSSRSSSRESTACAASFADSRASSWETRFSRSETAAELLVGGFDLISCVFGGSWVGSAFKCC